MKNTGSHIGYLRFGSNAERRKSNGKQRQSEQTVSYLHQGIQKLGNLQKIRDGEPLGGKASAESDFATDDDDDFLN